jgi:predicted metal-binding membrane protein
LASVLVEKIVPHGHCLARAAGALFVATGIVVMVLV